MREDRKLKYHSEGHLKVMIEKSANRNLWDEVEEYAQELKTRREERLAKSDS